MTAKLTYDHHTVKFHSEKLLYAAQQFCHSKLNPSQSIVDIELEKAKAGSLALQCARVDERARAPIESLIQRANNKLALAEKIIECQLEGKIDPRVENLMTKLSQMKKNPDGMDFDTSFNKLFKSQMKLDRLDQHASNPKTVEALLNARTMVRELEMKLLLIRPQFTCFTSVLTEENNLYYQDLPNPEECKKMSSALFAIHYLSMATSKADMRVYPTTFPSPVDGIKHLAMANYIRKKKPIGLISIEEIIRIPDCDLTALKAILPSAETMLTYPSDAGVEEIQKQLEKLIEIKDAAHLKEMGAFIGIGVETLAIVFHRTGRISLYHPCGKEKGYEANFGNLAQAAEFLKRLTLGIESNPPIITLKPYCNKFAYEYAKWEHESEGRGKERIGKVFLSKSFPPTFLPSV